MNEKVPEEKIVLLACSFEKSEMDELIKFSFVEQDESGQGGAIKEVFVPKAKMHMADAIRARLLADDLIQTEETEDGFIKTFLAISISKEAYDRLQIIGKEPAHE